MSKEKTLIVITGPTATGKSALAVRLAKELGTEIISADSRQIYKGIPIVTAVPTEEEREGINHHLLEVLPLDGYYSAAKFASDADSIIQNIFNQSDYSIVCGGSMLYIDTLVNGIDELPTVPDEFRETLKKEHLTKGDEWLLNKLEELDPVYYHKIDHRNIKRVFHAVEITILSGKPYSSLLTGRDAKRDLPYKTIKFCLTGERELLFERINKRVWEMVNRGLENEARNVYDLRHLNSLNTVGLKEMFAYFECSMKYEEAIARIQKNTRVYAKKQMTWHKRDVNLNYLDFSSSMKENLDSIYQKL